MNAYEASKLIANLEWQLGFWNEELDKKDWEYTREYCKKMISEIEPKYKSLKKKLLSIELMESEV